MDPREGWGRADALDEYQHRCLPLPSRGGERHQRKVEYELVVLKNSEHSLSSIGEDAASGLSSTMNALLRPLSWEVAAFTGRAQVQTGAVTGTQVSLVWP